MLGIRLRLENEGHFDGVFEGHRVLLSVSLHTFAQGTESTYLEK